MENLKNNAIKFLVENEKFKRENLEFNRMSNGYLVTASNDLGCIFYNFYYDKNGELKYLIEKEENYKTKNNTPDDKGQGLSVLQKINILRKNTDENEDILSNKIIEAEEKLKNNKNLEKRVKELENECGLLKKGQEELKNECGLLKKELNKFKYERIEIERYIDKWIKSRTVTQEQIDQIKELVNEGKTESEIVKLTGTSKGTIWRVKRNIL